MKAIILLLAIFIFISCEDEGGISYKAAHCRKCTIKQTEMVEEYFNLCKQTAYSTVYCLDRAIVMHCDTITCTQSNK